jgi:hypothetical protein
MVIITDYKQNPDELGLRVKTLRVRRFSRIADPAEEFPVYCAKLSTQLFI